MSDITDRGLFPAFLAADQAAEESERRREFRRGLIESLPVSPAVQRLLLAIETLCHADGLADEAGNDWVEATRYEIAHAMDRSVSAVKIHLRSARTRGFVEVEETPGRPNLIGLLWPAIFEAAQGSDRGGAGRGVGRGRDRGVDIAPPTAPPPPGVRKKGGARSALHGIGVGSGDGSYSGDLTKTPPPLTKAGAGVLERCSGESGKQFRWGRSIDPAELRDPDAIEELFTIVAGSGLARDSEHDRLAFFALVAHVHAQTSAKNPIALLTSILTGRCRDRFIRRGGDWRSRPCDRDWEAARSLLRRLAREEDDLYEPQPQAGYDVEAARVREFEAERSRQQRALQEALRRGDFDD